MKFNSSNLLAVLTLHFEEDFLAHHRVSVETAQVEALVWGLHVGDLQVPVIGIVLDRREAMARADGHVVDRQDQQSLLEDPCHLGIVQ